MLDFYFMFVKVMHVLFLKKYLFTYLTVPGLSCLT